MSLFNDNDSLILQGAFAAYEDRYGTSNAIDCISYIFVDSANDMYEYGVEDGVCEKTTQLKSLISQIYSNAMDLPLVFDKDYSIQQLDCMIQSAQKVKAALESRDNLTFEV